jgi:NAD(P)H-dependent FMN reductase
MKNILAIGGSNSKKSINKILATHIANQIKEVTVSTLNWDEIVLPLYSPDLEEESGIPEKVQYFLDLVKATDGIVLSLAEYNGSFAAAFKNLWDWSSRIDQKIWANKPMFLSATSPGGRGGMGVIAHVKGLMPHFGGNVIVDYSLPSFFDNFKDGEVIQPELQNELKLKIEEFSNSI